MFLIAYIIHMKQCPKISCNVKKYKYKIKLSLNSTQGMNGTKTTTELCPPNPNEFEIAAESKTKIRNIQK